jgi:hypothetical protein
VGKVVLPERGGDQLDVFGDRFVRRVLVGRCRRALPRRHLRGEVFDRNGIRVLGEVVEGVPPASIQHHLGDESLREWVLVGSSERPVRVVGHRLEDAGRCCRTTEPRSVTLVCQPTALCYLLVSPSESKILRRLRNPRRTSER